MEKNEVVSHLAEKLWFHLILFIPVLVEHHSATNLDRFRHYDCWVKKGPIM